MKATLHLVKNIEMAKTFIRIIVITKVNSGTKILIILYLILIFIQS